MRVASRSDTSMRHRIEGRGRARPASRDAKSERGQEPRACGIVDRALHKGSPEVRPRMSAEIVPLAPRRPLRLAPSTREEPNAFGTMVGRSEAMRRVFAALEKAAATDATVLLLGETGTGKEAAAESIHLESARREAPFVVVDCAAVPPSLLESELFGHER